MGCNCLTNCEIFVLGNYPLSDHLPIIFIPYALRLSYNSSTNDGTSMTSKFFNLGDIPPMLVYDCRVLKAR